MPEFKGYPNYAAKRQAETMGSLKNLWAAAQAAVSSPEGAKQAALGLAKMATFPFSALGQTDWGDQGLMDVLEAGAPPIGKKSPWAGVKGVYTVPTIEGKVVHEVADALADRKPAQPMLVKGINKRLAEYNAIGEKAAFERGGVLFHPDKEGISYQPKRLSERRDMYNKGIPINDDPAVHPYDTETVVMGLDRGDHTELVPPYTILNKIWAWGEAAKDAQKGKGPWSAAPDEIDSIFKAKLAGEKMKK